MEITREREVYVTTDGLGRAAIVEHDDGLFRVYVHWKWAPEMQRAMKVLPTAEPTWFTDTTPREYLYEDVPPKRGVYKTVEQARHAIFNESEFRDAQKIERPVG